MNVEEDFSNFKNNEFLIFLLNIKCLHNSLEGLITISTNA